MKLLLNEKTSLFNALARAEQLATKLGFDQIESDAAKDAVKNFHSLLTSPQGQNINSEFEKMIKGGNGKTLKIKGSSSSQQGIISRFLSA